MTTAAARAWRGVALATIAVLLYALPPLSRAYADSFRATVNGLARGAGVTAWTLEERPPAGARFDSRLVVREGRGRWSYSFDSAAVGLLPAVLFLLLAGAAGPWAPTSRASLFLGLLLTQLYALARLAIFALEGFTRHAAAGGCGQPHGPFWTGHGVRATSRVLSELESDATVYVFVPFLIWLAVTRALLLRQLVARPEPPLPSTGAEPREQLAFLEVQRPADAWPAARATNSRGATTP